jgi:hypothetical protein
MTTTDLQLLISIFSPVVAAVLVGFTLHRIGKRFENDIWRNQKLIEKRLALYGEVATPLNALYCFFCRVGVWKDTKPAEALALKRKIDASLYAFFPLFGRATYRAYVDFMTLLFDTFRGPGLDAALRLDASKYAYKLRGWRDDWEQFFSTDANRWSHREVVHKAYKALVTAFATDIGVNAANAWELELPTRSNAGTSGAPGGTQANERGVTQVPDDQKWASRAEELCESSTDPALREYVTANLSAIYSAMRGQGPDTGEVIPASGAHAVANMSSVHIPAFVRLSRQNAAKPYKNGYDLGKFVVGDPTPARALKTREIVDRALPINGTSPGNVYYCAVELNGSGMRFYGDAALVIKHGQTAEETIVLDRNSFDLARRPMSARIEAANDPAAERAQIAQEMSGSWKRDLHFMAATKVLPAAPLRTRRLTTGVISDAVLTDEDYIEVLRVGSFGIGQLKEVRFSGADAASDALIGDRLRVGFAPDLAALLWRHRRRRAERLLRRTGVRTVTVTTTGRARA